MISVGVTGTLSRDFVTESLNACLIHVFQKTWICRLEKDF